MGEIIFQEFNGIKVLIREDGAIVVNLYMTDFRKELEKVHPGSYSVELVAEKRRQQHSRFTHAKPVAKLYKDPPLTTQDSPTTPNTPHIHIDESEKW